MNESTTVRSAQVKPIDEINRRYKRLRLLNSQTNAAQKTSISPQACTCAPPTEGASNENSGLVMQGSEDQSVYVIGHIQPVFPSLDVQREYESAASQLQVSSDDYSAVFNSRDYLDKSKTISYRPYLYIAHNMCWVLSVSDIDTYIVIPNSVFELDLIINALADEGPINIAGILGPIAPENFCLGLHLPIIWCSYLASANQSSVDMLPLMPNDGITDLDRALNYFALSFSELVGENSELKPNIDGSEALYLACVSPKLLSEPSTRKVVSVILEYRDTDKNSEVFYSVSIDVTNELPFVEQPLRLYLPE